MPQASPTHAQSHATPSALEREGGNDPVVPHKPDMQPLVSLEQGSLSRNGNKIVDHVTLSVQSGEIVTVIGPNGAGKSTLIKMMLGLIPLTSGRLHRRQNLQIGYVPQSFRHADAVPMDVGRLMRLTGHPNEQEIKEALEETGIAHLLRAQVDSLSGGELQRALLARAIVRKPDLLVLDEPVQAVDFIGEIKIYQLIAAIRTKLGCGVLMVSHDLHVVMAESDRVVCLNGHICCEGKPERVRQDPEFTRMFGPAAARMVAAYKHHHDHEHDVCDGASHDHHHHAPHR